MKKLVVIALVPLFLYGCSDNSTGPNNDDPSNEVVMSNHRFNPDNLVVPPGTTITWINEDQDTHTVTSGTGNNADGLFNSGNIPPGGEFQFTFDEEGSFHYFCIPHVGMTGVITVESN